MDRTQPAPKEADDALFKSMSPELRKLNKQARKEKRLEARAKWKAQHNVQNRY